MRHIAIIIILITTSLNCTAQNDTTKDGLKVGRWVEEFKEWDGDKKASGYYKIIPKRTYHISKIYDKKRCEIKYKRTSLVLFYSGVNKRKISVRDSIWQAFDSVNKQLITKFYDKGLVLWIKHFDTYGNLTYLLNENYDNDSIYSLYYINNQLFCETFRSPHNVHHKKIYYPNNNLSINNAELYFKSNFSSKDAWSSKVKLSAKSETKILSISASSKNIQIYSQYKNFPIKVNKNDTAFFDLIFDPTPASFKPNDTITIQTDEKNVPPYRIYCSLSASHLDRQIFTVTKEFSLSKSKDKYLVIAPLGRVTVAYISNELGLKKNYLIEGVTKIDLKNFEAGEYLLLVAGGCDVSKDIKLKIVE